MPTNEFHLPIRVDSRLSSTYADQEVGSAPAAGRGRPWGGLVPDASAWYTKSQRGGREGFVSGGARGRAVMGRGGRRWAGANPEQKRAVRRLWDGGGRVMLVRGPQGVGKTTLPQAGRSALRTGTAGPKALTNLVPAGQRMYHPLRPRGWLACR